eukprot:2608137-Amphidinium_carterae.1
MELNYMQHGDRVWGTKGNAVRDQELRNMLTQRRARATTLDEVATSARSTAREAQARADEAQKPNLAQKELVTACGDPFHLSSELLEKRSSTPLG